LRSLIRSLVSVINVYRVTMRANQLQGLILCEFDAVGDNVIDLRLID